MLLGYKQFVCHMCSLLVVFWVCVLNYQSNQFDNVFLSWRDPRRRVVNPIPAAWTARPKLGRNGLFDVCNGAFRVPAHPALAGDNPQSEAGKLSQRNENKQIYIDVCVVGLLVYNRVVSGTLAANNRLGGFPIPFFEQTRGEVKDDE